jgi:hypothetical protein
VRGSGSATLPPKQRRGSGEPSDSRDVCVRGAGRRSQSRLADEGRKIPVKSAYLLEVNLMAQTAVNWTEKRNRLKAKRDWLFKQFEANPSNVRSGQEIKKLDDEVAECEKHLTLERSGIAKA